LQTDTPEIGLGTTLADDTEATLGADDAGCENIFEGAAVADVEGTAYVAAQTRALLIQAAGAHTVHLNVADTWGDTAAPAELTATGTVTLFWKFLGVAT
jgi:hypothetical protein